MTIYASLSAYTESVQKQYTESQKKDCEEILGQTVVLVKMAQAIHTAILKGEKQAWLDALTNEPSIVFHPSGEIQFL